MVSDKAQEAGATIRRFGEEGPIEPGAAQDDANGMTLRAAVKIAIAYSGKKWTQKLEDEIVSVVVDGVPPERPTTNYRPSGPTRITSVEPGAAEDDPTLRTRKSVLGR